MDFIEIKSDVKQPDSVDYIVHEATVARFQDEIDRMEKRNAEDRKRDDKRYNRLVIALIVSVILIFVTNACWLYYESLFDTVTYAQDGEGLNNVNTGKQGDVTNGPEGEDQIAKKRESKGR